MVKVAGKPPGGALAERGRRPVPDLALADRNLELVCSHRRRRCNRSRDDGRKRTADNVEHGAPSLVTMQRA
jgi:hypothetical protein